MRFFALGILSSLALALSACGDDKDPITTLTNTTPAGPTSDPTATDGNGTTTNDGQTSGTTADNPTTTEPTTTATTEPSTTTSPGTTTTEPSTTTTEPGTGTSEPGTTTGTETTGGGIEPGSDYGFCSNDQMNPVMCDSMFCIDPVSTGDQVKGAFCSPKCSGPGMLCQKPDGASAQLQAACLFDTNMDMKGDICALVCPLESDICPTGMTCEDIGIPEQMGMKFGICTHPV